METPTNGSLELLNQIRSMTEVKGSKVATRDALLLLLRSQEYIIKRMNAEALCNMQRDKDIRELRDKNIVIWVQSNPKMAVFLGGVFMVVTAGVNWGVMGAKVIGGLVKQWAGIEIP